MRLIYLLCIVLSFIDLVLTGGTSKSKGEKVTNLASVKCSDISSEGSIESCLGFCQSLDPLFIEGECVRGICLCRTEVTKPEQNKRLERPGVKCRNLIRLGGQIGSENHRGCRVHCKLMNTTSKDGHCVQGICQCDVNVQTKALRNEKEFATCKEGEDEDCLTYCRESKGHTDGRCTNGLCRCHSTTSTTFLPQQHLHHLPDDFINRSLKRCTKSASEDECVSFCKAFSKDHGEGRCVENVCQCGYAVFENAESNVEEVSEKGTED